MKKIKHYDERSLDFHDLVVSNKHHHPTDPGYKTRIRTLRSISEPRFREYDSKFNNDKLEELEEEEYTNKQKADLKSLYDFDVQPFPVLYKELSKDEKGRKNPYCPLCDMEGVSSFDHILPQSKFPEFSDHPLNLIRSCQKCNGKKSSNWLEGAKRRYVNLYIDDIPNKQFLFVKIEIDEEEQSLIVDFSVENRYGIESELYRKIENHFVDLEICSRYEEGCSEVISSLQDDVVNNLDIGASRDDIKSSILNKCSREQARYGVNYWRAILKQACAENDEILDYIISKSLAGEDVVA